MDCQEKDSNPPTCLAREQRACVCVIRVCHRVTRRTFTAAKVHDAAVAPPAAPSCPQICSSLPPILVLGLNPGIPGACVCVCVESACSSCVLLGSRAQTSQDGPKLTPDPSPRWITGTVCSCDHMEECWAQTIDFNVHIEGDARVWLPPAVEGTNCCLR